MTSPIELRAGKYCNNKDFLELEAIATRVGAIANSNNKAIGGSWPYY